ncbi:MAG: enoyl-CoA hydratase/isomerase family protein [Acidimicrobiales bacterium]
MTDETARPPEGDWLGTRFLHFERRGSLAVVTVDRPHRRNAMTPSMYFGVRYAVDHVNRTDELAGLVITGTGDVFIPGGDIGGDDETPWGQLGLLGMEVTPFEAVRNSRKPVVSAVNGICQGGGLLIAMLSDVTVVAPTATFRAPETLRGIADTGYAQYLPAQIGIPRARDMLLTGRTIDAATALDWGLATRLAQTDDVVAEGLEVLTEATRAAPEARVTVKREINRQYGYYDRVSMEAGLFNPEYAEGFAAFKERRAPNWIPPDLRPDGRL